MGFKRSVLRDFRSLQGENASESTLTRKVLWLLCITDWNHRLAKNGDVQPGFLNLLQQWTFLGIRSITLSHLFWKTAPGERKDIPRPFYFFDFFASIDYVSRSEEQGAVAVYAGKYQLLWIATRLNFFQWCHAKCCLHAWNTALRPKQNERHYSGVYCTCGTFWNSERMPISELLQLFSQEVQHSTIVQNCTAIRRTMERSAVLLEWQISSDYLRDQQRFGTETQKTLNGILNVENGLLSTVWSFAIAAPSLTKNQIKTLATSNTRSTPGFPSEAAAY